MLDAPRRTQQACMSPVINTTCMFTGVVLHSVVPDHVLLRGLSKTPGQLFCDGSKTRKKKALKAPYYSFSHFKMFKMVCSLKYSSDSLFVSSSCISSGA